MKPYLAYGLALAGAVTLIAPQAFAAAKPAPEETQPQIVRIAYLEGDVRVSRGTEGGAPKDVDWEKAVTGLPLQAGFTLVTDDGRAEIELEDSSTLYLAPNSVLIFNALDSTANVPHTELALLSGTLTLDVHPEVKGDTFILRTPTDTMATSYRQKANLRVTAYIDAIGITSLQNGLFRTSKDTVQIERPGHTSYFRNGKPVDYAGPIGENDYAAWDKWVAGRVTQRDESIAQMLKETGLKTPVPGLAQMAGQGKFVDCPGYGKCWQPPAPSASPLNTANLQSKPASSLLPAHSAYTLAGEPASPPAVSPNWQSGYGAGYENAAMSFPCGPDSLLYYNRAMMQRVGMSYGMGYGMGMAGGFGYFSDPWTWAVCHSGSWIFQQNQYLWVPGQMIFRQMPVRWIKNGGKVGYVPTNPRDVAGKLPLNAQHGIFTIGNKSRFSVERTPFGAGDNVKLLDNAPREFRKPSFLPLVRTDAPRMEARMIRPDQQNVRSVKVGEAKAGALRAGIDSKGASGPARGIPIVFDHRSQSFMMARQVVQGSGIRTVNEPVGSYLARSGATFGGSQSFLGQAGGFRGENGARSGFSGNNSAATGFRGAGLTGGSRGGEGGFGGASASRVSGGASAGGVSHGGGGFSPAAGGGAPSGGGSAPASGGGHR